ncbi:molybdenum ABC transporter ATP-binding protein [Ketobacter sp.]|uniref:molybdenum ABC transporter ATP-binding protein n=1 Tax=Ketobacter sp. TaxID=2083498 RepID=UPI000F15BABB|nr:molybdenum ABC transporter ATP-binding protein [Ketobacter sp.]RLT92601.1 MAG: molybdenum ABC transporter ATP-binding protein [Ketobacter sp.]
MSGIEFEFQLPREDFKLQVSGTLPDRGITALFGASGSGKTTLLRCIAGLERAPGGKLVVNGEVWQQGPTFLATHQRPIGYVFQEASLFAHLGVQRNLEYGWKRIPRPHRNIEFEEVIRLLGLEHLLGRFPHQLSGGQRQRVAIARALLTSPALLLMDEPLSALDLDSKQEILPYLERLHDESRVPILYVSHSPDEVVRLADHLVLMEHGKIVAQGEINQLLTRSDLSLSRLDEASAVLKCRVAAHDPDYHVSYVAIDNSGLKQKLLVPFKDLPTDHPVRVRILARDVSLALQMQSQTSISNILPARVVEVFPSNTPFQVIVKLDIGGQFILSKITKRSAALLHIEKDKLVYAQVKSVALMR